MKASYIIDYVSGSEVSIVDDRAADNSSGRVSSWKLIIRQPSLHKVIIMIILLISACQVRSLQHLVIIIALLVNSIRK